MDADSDPASAFTDIARILARGAIRIALRRKGMELEPCAEPRLTVPPTVGTDAVGKETE